MKKLSFSMAAILFFTTLLSASGDTFSGYEEKNSFMMDKNNHEVMEAMVQKRDHMLLKRDLLSQKRDAIAQKRDVREFELYAVISRI